MKRNYIRVIVELIVWSFFIGFPLLIFPSFKPYLSEGRFQPLLTGILITHVFLIGFYYFNYYYALPRFYFTRSYPVYFLLTISLFLILTFVMLSRENFNPLSSTGFGYPKFLFVFSIFIRFLIVFLISVGFASYQRLKQTEEEKLRAELSFLKAQINPHFLFNTLNSIYALTVLKSNSAPEAITRLSAIMRYVISEAAQEYVPLEKEINYISSYVELEKLRLTNKVELNYAVNGNTQGKQIAPLIFIPLVENAFKYGVSTIEASAIAIRIDVSEQQLSLYVSNTKHRHDKSNSNDLGIENVKRRLNLLYLGKHHLTIEDQEKNFVVNLTMQLND
jgi:sensor histidine kinase YesM